MPENVISNNSDGQQSSGLIAASGGWNSAHDAVGAGSPTTTQTESPFFGPGAQFGASRGGIYFIVRCFFDFNLSSITNGTITAASFGIMTSSNGEGIENIVVKSGHDPSTTSDDWFSTWLTGQGITLSGWSSSDVTAYSANVAAAASGVFTEYPLNSSALTELNSLSQTSTPFKIALLNFDFDYSDVDPQPSSGVQRTGVIFSEFGNSLRRPFLELTISTGYGNKVINVAAGSIGKVNGVATANVSKVVGVD